MAKNTDNITEKTIDVSNGDVTIEGFFDKEKRYGLKPLEHRILSKPETGPQEWSKRFLLISIGLFFTVICKLIVFIYKYSISTQTEKCNLDPDIETWEIIYLVIGSLICLSFWLYSKSKRYQSEKQILIRKINLYFDGDKR